MSKQPKRYARVEVVRATTLYLGKPPKPSARPHFLRLVAANGEILAHSENYSTRANARRAVGSWVQAFRDVLAAPVSVRVSDVAS